MKKLMLSLMLIFCSVNAQAILLTDLLNGGSIIAGDKEFDDWDVLFSGSSDFRLFDTDNIDVTALNDGGLEPGPGLRYDISNGMFDLEGDGVFAFLDFQFSFSVSVLDPLLQLKDNSLILNDYDLFNSIDLSSVFIEEFVYADDRVTQLGNKNVEASELSDGIGGFTSTEKLQDSAVFAAQDSIWVTTNILLEAFDPADRVLLSGFEQRFSQATRRVDVPEPDSMLLWGLGLLMFIVRRLRVK